MKISKASNCLAVGGRVSSGQSARPKVLPLNGCYAVTCVGFIGRDVLTLTQQLYHVLGRSKVLLGGLCCGEKLSLQIVTMAKHLHPYKQA